MCFDTRVHSRFFLTLPRSPWAKMMLSCICYLFVCLSCNGRFLSAFAGTKDDRDREDRDRERERKEKKDGNEHHEQTCFYPLATLLACRVLPLSFILLGANQLIWIVFMNKSPESQGF